MRLSLVLILVSIIAVSADITNEMNVELGDCRQPAMAQQWTYSSSDKTIRLKDDSTFCLDISNYGTTDGANVWLYACHTSDKDPKHQNQEWDMNSDGSIVSTMSGLCMDAANDGVTPGTNVQIWKCAGTDNQKWFINSTDSTLRGKQSGLCLNVAQPFAGNPCSEDTNKNLPWCDTSLSFEARVKDLINRIPTAERIGLFANGASGVSSLQIPGYQWWSEASHGVAHSPGVHFGGNVPAATSFPQVISTGCAFDPQLVAQIGEAVGTEGRAMNNEGHAGLTFWAPNVNIFRDPRWGRGQETPGEDPYHTSEYAYNFVSNMQSGDPKYIKVSSCCKHFAAYDMENWGGKNRHDFNAICTQQDLEDTYYPAFKSCAMRGKASSVMCSYNAVNGVPSCANRGILNDLLRAKWGFEGYVTSDCGAVSNVLSTHHYTNSTDQTCKVTLEAGMDIDCGGFLKQHLAQAISDNAVSKSTVDAALTNLFMVQMRLGFFDDASLLPKFKGLTAKDVDTTAHRALAMTAALRAMTLLKNDQNALPLDKNVHKTIALVGPNADATSVMQGNYYGTAPFLVSPQDGLKKMATVNYVKGCDISSTDKSGFTAACDAAKAADATVLVMGLDQSQEREGHDRTIISLPGVQDDFITSVSECSKGPVVLVIMAGGSVDISAAKNSSKVGAIMFVGYPGQSGGDAIAQTIYGEYSPAGRMPYTIYPASYISGFSMLDMGMRPSSTNPGRSYRFYPGPTVYDFGHGLSYTTFNVSSTLSEKMVFVQDIKKGMYGDYATRDWDQPSIIQATTTVKNTGKVTSDYTLLSFVRPPNGGKDGNPIKYLNFFTRLYAVTPGENRTVTVPVRPIDLTLTNAHGVRMAAPGTWKLEIGPYAAASQTFTVQ